MTEANVVATIRQAIQDLIAPDLRELKANQAALEKIVDVRFEAVDVRFTAVDERFVSFEKRIDERFVAFEKRIDERFVAFEKRIDERFVAFEKRIDERFVSLEKVMEADSQKRDAQFAALLAHLREASAEARNATTQQVYDLAQRVAVVEARQTQDHPRQLS